MTDESDSHGWKGEAGWSGDADERVEIPAVRTGVDEDIAIFWAGLFMIVATVCVCLSIHCGSASWGVAALGSWVAAALAAIGTRWRVRIDSDGLEFRRWFCGFPVQRKRFLLDVEFSRYWTWEQPGYDQGIEIFDPRGGFDDATGCFGPYRRERAQVELISWLEAALQEARVLSGARERGLRCTRLDGKLDAVQPSKWGLNGEVRQARTTHNLMISGVSVPEGSTLLFNDDMPVRDPRRDDTLRGVRLSEGSVLPNGFELSPDALVSFIGEGIGVHENGPGRIERDGVAMYVEDVKFDAEWQPTHFKTADSVEVDGFEIPAESDVKRIRGLDRGSYWFHVRLARSVEHLGVRYDEDCALFFDSGKRFLRAHSSRLLDATFAPDSQTAGSVEKGRGEHGEI